ncbi:uncharacterized protein LOC116338055 isoform X1 [Contarinia nasturtii]|uniref:uncharacterized protein LOC116338055 isoform X1 n=1 Tax=Contarinia nasturtii TaxID=265458 RepID=UPI0012D4B631|nr:uncharacterized protein LOC116338055 isoform X1 [Contarinia nasturtii]
MTKMISCHELERAFFKHVSPTESRSSTPIEMFETKSESAVRDDFQWFLSSLLVPTLKRTSRPFKTVPEQLQRKTETNGLPVIAMLCRLKVECERKRLFSNIYEGPISNRGKVRLN